MQAPIIMSRIISKPESATRLRLFSLAQICSCCHSIRHLFPTCYTHCYCLENCCIGRTIRHCNSFKSHVGSYLPDSIANHYRALRSIADDVFLPAWLIIPQSFTLGDGDAFNLFVQAINLLGSCQCRELSVYIVQILNVCASATQRSSEFFAPTFATND